MRVAVEAGGNQRAVMGGQAVRICVCMCVSPTVASAL